MVCSSTAEEIVVETPSHERVRLLESDFPCESVLLAERSTEKRSKRPKVLAVHRRQQLVHGDVVVGQLDGVGAVLVQHGSKRARLNRDVAAPIGEHQHVPVMVASSAEFSAGGQEEALGIEPQAQPAPAEFHGDAGVLCWQRRCWRSNHEDSRQTRRRARWRRRRSP